MDSMDNFRERFEALEQWTEQLKQQLHALEAQTPTLARQARWWRGIACGVGLLGLVSLAPASQAADFACAAGDVACLITAITTANANGEANSITLEAGTYTLTAVDNTTDGPNGLPSVTGIVTIKGAGADATSLERDTSAPAFRFGHVAATGNLTLAGLTMRRGQVSVNGGHLLNQGGTVTLTNTTLSGGIADTGGCLFTQGGTVTLAQTTVTGCNAFEAGAMEITGGAVFLIHTIVAHNSANVGAGGISNFGGTVSLLQSTLLGNATQSGFGGALQVARGTAAIIDSAITDNSSSFAAGGIAVGGLGNLTILNSTIAGNRSTGSGGGLVAGPAIIINSTIADNQAQGGGGLVGIGIAPVLLNTLLARNTAVRPDHHHDCEGTVISLGNNLIGDTTGCTVTLQPTDRTGDPGLGAFTDNGTPGNGHIPLRRGSPAIDAGNEAACPARDQLGRRRIGPCDIGAIEFRHRDNRQHEDDPAAAAQAAQ
jgi:hypothetical protein